MTLTQQDKARLRAMGIYVYDQFKSTGECVVEQNGHHMLRKTAYLKRLANPSLWDRMCNWLVGRSAA